MDYNFIKWLIEQGADVNLDNGKSILTAAEYATPQIAQLIFEAGATQEHLLAALTVAKQRNRTEVIRLIEKLLPPTKAIGHAGNPR